MNKAQQLIKLFQGLTLMVRGRPEEFVWATYEEIPHYLDLGYVIVNEQKRVWWERNVK